jgi:hypothetical protein
MVAKLNLHRSVVGTIPAEARHQSLQVENSPLSSAEKEELSQCEAVIQTRLKAFFEVGHALIEINRNRLYRTEYHSFEEYCRNRWDMSRVHAFRLLRAAEVHKALSPIGNIPLPENEAQIRPLTGLTPKKAQAAWEKVIKMAQGERVTAKLVRLTVSGIEKHCGENLGLQTESHWQHELNLLVHRIKVAAEKGDLEQASAVIEKIRLLIDIEIAREARSAE